MRCGESVTYPQSSSRDMLHESIDRTLSRSARRRVPENLEPPPEPADEKRAIGGCSACCNSRSRGQVRDHACEWLGWEHPGNDRSPTQPIRSLVAARMVCESASAAILIRSLLEPACCPQDRPAEPDAQAAACKMQPLLDSTP